MNDLSDEQRRELAKRACDIRQNAYARYSKYLVGASIVTEDGSFFDGVNVENASFGLTNCAERTALFTAVAAGHRSFRAIAVASKGRCAPCGACRQVLAEFGPDMSVVLVDPDRPESIAATSMRELLPNCFELPETD